MIMIMIISLILLGSLLPHLSFSASVNVEIVNGREARPHSRPYMVSIQKNGKHICGGFLISNKFVMTAAHCSGSTETPLTVVAGAHDITNENQKSVRIGVSSYVHPTYRDVPGEALQGDIMILKLNKKVKLNKNIKTIPIPKKPGMVKEGTVCSVAGWGRLETNGTTSSTLREAEVKIMNETYCETRWKRDYNASQMMCVYGHGGTCKGDSGGPLVCGKTAVGVTSFGSPKYCNDRHLPNVSTEISAFLPWIKKVIKSAN